jgi:hypothetical protein
MPSTDRKLELKAKTSVAQTASQAAVCAKGLTPSSGSSYDPYKLLYVGVSGFGGLVVSMLTSGTQDHGFEPGQSCEIFQAKKSTACLPLEGK